MKLVAETADEEINAVEMIGIEAIETEDKTSEFIKLIKKQKADFIGARNSFKCEQCNYKLMIKNTLVQHKRKEHMAVNVKIVHNVANNSKPRNKIKIKYKRSIEAKTEDKVLEFIRLVNKQKADSIGARNSLNVNNAITN